MTALYAEVHGQDVPHEEVFDLIYAAALWGADGVEGTSVSGSNEEATAPYRKFVAEFIRQKAITGVLDIGCGDWRLGRLMDRTGVHYTGIDVSSVVMKATRKFGSEQIRFLEGDARTTSLPPADLILIKDVLQHRSNKDIADFLPKLAPYRHALVTNNWPLHSMPNSDIQSGGFRPLDLSRAPFEMPGDFVLTYDAPTERGSESKRVFLVAHTSATLTAPR